MTGLSPINTLEYDIELCTACGMCSIVCPHGVFEQTDHAALAVNPDACIECGACQLNCPTGAIRVDSGVGCAAALIRAAVVGADKVSCDPEDSSCCSVSG